MTPFYKLQATGNDFIFLLESEGAPQLLPTAIQNLCRRRTGVGADGVVFLKNSKNDVDFEWVFYNADGGEAEMCGNAARCAILLLDERLGRRSRTVKTRAGVFSGQTAENAEVEVEFSVPAVATVPLKNLFNGKFREGYLTNTGVPHCVIPVEDPLGLGERSRELAPFIFAKEFGAAGANLTFVNWENKSPMESVTLERGVNDFTLSCGTGVIAAVRMFSEIHKHSGWCRVKTPGGVLAATYDPVKHRVQLRGPAALVYKGVL